MPQGRIVDTSTAIKRDCSAYLDSVLGHSFPVLDHGFIRVVSYMGDDSAIVQVARVSYGSGTKEVSDDRGLIRYLMRHHHSTPFEMCEIKLHVKLPIFVARQWIRHRTANVNEVSARYSILDREFYIPEPEQMAVQATNNKQGRAEILDPEKARAIQEWLIRESGRSYDAYIGVSKPVEDGGGYGLARELARMNLPTNIYTQWYWKVDLHNLLHFLRLRADSHAQWEIRQYANVICELVAQWVPHAFEAFQDYRQHAVTFSRQEVEIIRGVLRLYQVSPEMAAKRGLSQREIAEFVNKIGGAA